MSESKELAVVDPKVARIPMTDQGLRPRDLDGLWRYAVMISKSPFAPKGMDKPETIAVAIDYGLTLGLAPLQALQNIGVINGKPCLYGDTPLALIRASGLVEWIKETIDGAGDSRTATFAAKRKDDPNPIIRTFSVADAKRAKLWGKSGPWSDYPDRMLMFRARGFGARDSFPDVLKGMITEHEARDLPPISADTAGLEIDIMTNKNAPLPEPITEAPAETTDTSFADDLLATMEPPPKVGTVGN